MCAYDTAGDVGIVQIPPLSTTIAGSTTAEHRQGSISSQTIDEGQWGLIKMGLISFPCPWSSVEEILLLALARAIAGVSFTNFNSPWEHLF